jgi:hypothetical protein
MKKQIFANSLIYFVCIIAACLINLAVSALVLKILNAFIVVDYFVSSIINAVISFVVVSGIIGAVMFYEGYKAAEFNVGLTAASFSLSGVYHLIISLVLMFYPFIAGGTRYLAGLMSLWDSFDGIEAVADIYLWAYLVAFVIYFAVQLGVALCCGVWGKNKRLKNREELLANGQ